jgi:hypothetical protein
MVDDVNEAYFGRFPEEESAPEESERRARSRGMAPAGPEGDRTEPLEGDVESHPGSFPGKRGSAGNRRT